MVKDAVARFLAAHAIDRLVVAVSGGPDSTALLVALAELRVDVVAAHVNHRLRGDESNGDERFVRDLCERLGVRVVVADGTLDREAIRHRGFEAAAREVRHARLHEIRESLGMRRIATAHQLDDQAETVLMRMMTGSGLAGLRGIHPLREDGVVRPLLEVMRADVEAFLRERNIVARSDSSNADPRFLRNRVRAMLRELPPSVSRNLAAVAAQASAQWAIVEKQLDQYAVVATAEQTTFVQWPDDAWLRQALLLRHIRRLDPHSRDVSAADLARLTHATSRTSVTKNLELVGNVLRKRSAKPEAFEIAIAPGETKRVPGYAITLLHPATGNRQRFQVPSGGGFTVRNRRPGDRFRPLGMPHEKKLKDFLIDRKIPIEVRDSIPLLLWNDQIVWVAGIEISDAFKVTDPAGEQYEVWLERAGASVEATEDQASIHR